MSLTVAGIHDRERVQCESADEWRAWLVAHHQSSSGAWLITWKQHTGKPAPTYDEAVCQGLCVGWVDSRPSKLDQDRTMLYFAPRKSGSGWARPNKERIARLEADDLMLPAGQAVVDAARADGSWTMLDDVENLVVPPDLAAAFVVFPGSAEQWESFPRSAKRGILEWIVQAKRAETRATRIYTTAELAQRGERANQWPRP